MIETSSPLLAFLDPVNVEEVLQGNKIFLAIRIVVAVIGAALGWMLSALIWRGLYWIFTQKGMPAMLLVPLRLVSALAVAAAVFFFLPLGFGGLGGLGSGGGKGDGVGSGSGDGSGSGQKGSNPSESKEKSDGSQKSSLEKIDVVVLGGKDFSQNKLVYEEGKDYKVTLPGKQPIITTLKYIETQLNDRQNKVSVILHITKRSVDGPPQDELIHMLKDRKIAFTQVAE